MRNRPWRRYMEERIVKRRLTYLAKECTWWRGFEDVNGFIIQHPRFIDYLGTKQHFDAKTLSTDRWNTKQKIKYSPNKSKNYYRANKKNQTREYVKREFLKILKENGIK